MRVADSSLRSRGHWFATLALVVLCAPLAAQGTITGTLKDIAGTTTWFAEPVTIAAIVLPDESHPFNEICAGTWQEAMDALAQGRKPETPFGGLAGGVTPIDFCIVQSDADGRFQMLSLPLERRIAVAAKIDSLWWPLEREQWLTEATPSAQVELPFFTLDHDSLPTLREHRLEVHLTVRPDLKYAGLTIDETILIENSDPSRGMMLEISLDVAMAPDILARHLPSLYGSQLFFMQGTSSLPAESASEASALARQAWRFGGVDVMHGAQAVYNKGPQFSADNWHPLNTDGLHMLSAGDTRYIETPSPSARKAAIVFRRPVPPALHGKPGSLQLRLLHRAGVPLDNPAGKVAFARTFPHELLSATAGAHAGVVLQALVKDGHRRLYETQIAGDPTRMASTRNPALVAGEEVQIVLGLDDATQAELKSLSDPVDTPAAQEDKDSSKFRWDMLFKALAVVFGLAFVGALVASVRWSREKQLARLASLPASRAEVVAALKSLESEYNARRLPAAAYIEQRQRLLNRLIEFDARDDA
ncbi:MAG: hypothetical protein IT464_02145 [Planctomycetes bacterium]|nr:hypothetical protein [Planctomycetota bacterium]